jgi:hypothetical protein
MELNDYVLMTQRFYVQSYYVFLSSLAGSVLGIIGVGGFLMKFSERYYIKFGNKLAKKQLFHVIIDNVRKFKNGFPSGFKHKDSFKILRERSNTRSIDYIQGFENSYSPHENIIIDLSSQNYNPDVPYNSGVSRHQENIDSISLNFGSAEEKHETTSFMAKRLHQNKEKVVKRNKVAPKY